MTGIKHNEMRVEKRDIPHPNWSKEAYSQLWRACACCYDGHVTLSDLIPHFGGRPVSVLNPMINHVIDYIYEIRKHCITEWNHAIMNPKPWRVMLKYFCRKGHLWEMVRGSGSIPPGKY